MEATSTVEVQDIGESKSAQGSGPAAIHLPGHSAEIQSDCDSVVPSSSEESIYSALSSFSESEFGDDGDTLDTVPEDPRLFRVDPEVAFSTGAKIGSHAHKGARIQPTRVVEYLSVPRWETVSVASWNKFLEEFEVYKLNGGKLLMVQCLTTVTRKALRMRATYGGF